MSPRLFAAYALCAGLASAAFAESVGPDAFEAMSEGRTLHFTLDGEPYGAEQYFSDRRALWRHADGTCSWGRWYPRDGLICFEYEAGAEEGQEPQCWTFEGGASGFSAALIEDGAPTGLTLDLDRTDTAPLDCPGPGVGS